MTNIYDIKLVDLIDLQELQQLQDSFAFVFDVASVITTPEGENITQESNFSDVCKLVGSTELGRQRCTQSNQCLGRQVAASMKPEVMNCMGCGFREASSPIIVSSVHMASWHISHKALGTNQDKLWEYALEIGLNPDDLISAWEQHTGISEDRFRELVNLLWLVTSQISNRSYAAYKAEAALKAQLQLHKKLQKQRDRLRRLASECMLTEERTKREIASELHDTIGHNLVTLKRNLYNYEKQALDKSMIERDCSAVEDIIAQTRSLTFRLSTPILYDFGIAAALEDLADEIFRPNGIEFHLVDHCPELQVQETYRMLYYRMCSELCYNILKHANASHVEVIFYRKGKNLIAEVSDDGVGFQYGRDGCGPRRGLGLFGIRERLKCYGGSIRVNSSSGTGTRVTLKLPGLESGE